MLGGHTCVGFGSFTSAGGVFFIVANFEAEDINFRNVERCTGKVSQVIYSGLSIGDSSYGGRSRW